MQVTIEHEVEVRCECGADLDVVEVDCQTSGRREGIIRVCVKPCDACMAEAESKGREEGKSNA